MSVLRDHPDWPRSVIRAVRNGQVCLDMTGGHLKASWGEPFQKSMAFTLGMGKHDMWFFRASDGAILTVSLQNDRVVGWVVEK